MHCTGKATAALSIPKLMMMETTTLTLMVVLGLRTLLRLNPVVKTFSNKSERKNERRKGKPVILVLFVCRLVGSTWIIQSSTINLYCLVSVVMMRFTIRCLLLLRVQKEDNHFKKHCGGGFVCSEFDLLEIVCIHCWYLDTFFCDAVFFFIFFSNCKTFLFLLVEFNVVWFAVNHVHYLWILVYFSSFPIMELVSHPFFVEISRFCILLFWTIFFYTISQIILLMLFCSR